MLIGERQNFVAAFAHTLEVELALAWNYQKPVVPETGCHDRY